MLDMDYRLFQKHIAEKINGNPRLKVMEIGPGVNGLVSACEINSTHNIDWTFVESKSALENRHRYHEYVQHKSRAMLEAQGACFVDCGLQKYIFHDVTPIKQQMDALEVKAFSEKLTEGEKKRFHELLSEYRVKGVTVKPDCPRFDVVATVHAFYREMSWLSHDIIASLLKPRGEFYTIGQIGTHTLAEQKWLLERSDILAASRQVIEGHVIIKLEKLAAPGTFSP